MFLIFKDLYPFQHLCFSPLLVPLLYIVLHLLPVLLIVRCLLLRPLKLCLIWSPNRKSGDLPKPP